MRRRGGKITVSTSLAQGDLERVHYLAAKKHQSVATWIRYAVAIAIDRELPGVALEELVCECGHMPSQHKPSGCEACRCARYRGER